MIFSYLLVSNLLLNILFVQGFDSNLLTHISCLLWKQLEQPCWPCVSGCQLQGRHVGNDSSMLS